MENVVIIGCGSYMDTGYGCPGEWRCLKAAGFGDGKFEKESRVIGFVKCECPGRTMVPNTGMTMKLAELKPDKIYLSSCLANAKPACPYSTAEEKAEMLKNQFGVEVIIGTHDYH